MVAVVVAKDIYLTDFIGRVDSSQLEVVVVVERVSAFSQIPLVPVRTSLLHWIQVVEELHRRQMVRI